MGKFIKDNMYKNIYKDVHMAFIVDEILSQDRNGAELIVTWYQQTDSGRYISIGVSGEFNIPKDQLLHYMEI